MTEEALFQEAFANSPAECAAFLDAAPGEDDPGFTGEHVPPRDEAPVRDGWPRDRHGSNRLRP